MPKNQNPEGSQRGSADYYDLSEEASKRFGEDSGAEQARQADSDGLGPISTPSGDNWGENKVSTSLSDE